MFRNFLAVLGLQLPLFLPFVSFPHPFIVTLIMFRVHENKLFTLRIDLLVRRHRIACPEGVLNLFVCHFLKKPEAVAFDKTQAPPVFAHLRLRKVVRQDVDEPLLVHLFQGVESFGLRPPLAVACEALEMLTLNII